MSKCWSRVSIQDGQEITHSVDVLADSVYEAIALAVAKIMPLVPPKRSREWVHSKSDWAN